MAIPQTHQLAPQPPPEWRKMYVNYGVSKTHCLSYNIEYPRVPSQSPTCPINTPHQQLLKDQIDAVQVDVPEPVRQPPENAPTYQLDEYEQQLDDLMAIESIRRFLSTVQLELEKINKFFSGWTEVTHVVSCIVCRLQPHFPHTHTQIKWL